MTNSQQIEDRSAADSASSYLTCRELSTGVQSAFRIVPCNRSVPIDRRFVSLLCLSLLQPWTRAGSLEPATLAAWDEYVQFARSSNEQRAASEDGFLWVDKAPGRNARVRAGEIVVAPTGRHGSTCVPDGLIHDWVGAAFVPGANLEDVAGALRDYSRYKDWFQPTVAESRLIASSEEKDRFSMVLVNKSFFKNMAIDTEYESRSIRLDDRRGYSISRSTRVQEIDDYGSIGQRLLPEGEGSGMVWRLMSITRYMERDGGVYLELQAIGLSRDIPASLRWMIEPVVRHVSRTSLMTSLRQTAGAILSSRGANASSLTESSWRFKQNR